MFLPAHLHHALHAFLHVIHSCAQNQHVFHALLVHLAHLVSHALHVTIAHHVACHQDAHLLHACHVHAYQHHVVVWIALCVWRATIALQLIAVFQQIVAFHAT